MSMSNGSGAWDWRLQVPLGLFCTAFRGALERGFWDMGTARWPINLP